MPKMTGNTTLIEIAWLVATIAIVVIGLYIFYAFISFVFDNIAAILIASFVVLIGVITLSLLASAKR